MKQAIIFQPFLATMILAMVVWGYMDGRRLPFILASEPNPKQVTPAEFARLSPPKVSNPSDNLKNQFELPTIFYALVLYVFMTKQVDAAYVGTAWGFFVFRALHSLVHRTFNHIPLRFYLYVISSVGLWFMVLRAAIVGIL